MTTYEVNGSAVSVTRTPSRTPRRRCGAPNSPWRPEFVAPIVALVTTEVRAPGDWLKFVSVSDETMGDEHGNIHHKLADNEYVISFFGGMVSVYDRSVTVTFCINIVVSGGFFIQLDLFSIQDRPAVL